MRRILWHLSALFLAFVMLSIVHDEPVDAAVCVDGCTPTAVAPNDVVPPAVSAPVSTETSGVVAVAELVEPIALGEVGEVASLPQPSAPAICTVGLAVDPALEAAVSSATGPLNSEMPLVRLVVVDSGPISVGFGGEWPAEEPPLGWTSPDKRTILINDSHPGSLIDAAVADVIAHELGHILIGESHTNDGTILDPTLDGQIRIGDADRAVLELLTCSELGL